MENDWIYLGVFLDDFSKDFLKKYYHVPEDWKKYYDHVTLAYNNGSPLMFACKEANMSHLGKHFNLRICAIGISEDAIAVKVLLPLGLVCANKTPHITLAVRPGSSPAKSNDITIWNEITDKCVVTGIVRMVGR